MDSKRRKKLMKIILPKSEPKFMPVNKPNQRFKTKKDYTRKLKHKKKTLE